MKILWFLAVAFSAIVLLLAPTVTADEENADPLEVVNEGEKVHIHESKLLNDVNEVNDDDEDEGEEALDEDIKQYDEIPDPMAITNKDVEQIKEPGMQRLARRLQSFHNNNLQRSYNHRLQPEDDANETPEERAVRIRRRIRRRNTINRVGGSISRRRKNSQRKSKKNKNKNGRRRSTKKTKTRKVKKNHRSKNKRRVVRRNTSRRRNGNRNGKRNYRNRRNRAYNPGHTADSEPREHNVNGMAAEKEAVA